MAVASDESDLAALSNLASIRLNVLERKLPATIATLGVRARRLETVIDNLSHGVCYFDAEERLILSNRRYAEIYRLDPRDIRPGATATEIVELRAAAGTTTMANDAYLATARAIQSSAVPGTWINELTDGRAIQVYYRPTPDGGWVATHEDITELHATRTVANDRLSLQTLIDWVPDYLWVKDATSRFVVANKAITSDSGRANTCDMIGLTDFDIHAPEAAQKFRAIEEDILRSGQPMIDREELIVNSSGAKKSLLTTKVPLRNDLNETIGLVGISRDITELQATRTLANERVTFQALIDFLPDNLWVKDVNSRFVICNKATASRMGFEGPDDLIGKSDLELLSPDIAEKFFSDEQTIVRTGRPMVDIEECVFGASGEKTWIQTTKVPFRNGQSEVFAVAGISRDITLQGKGYIRYEDLPLTTKTGGSINVEVVANSYDCDGVQVIQCDIRDITERAAAESQARRHAGLYVALSQCNHTMMHCTTEEELFPEICRIAVQLGGAKMAWVGVVDTETGSVLPVASWGDDTGYLKDIRISAKDDTPFGTGPIGHAIRTNQLVWLEDFANDPRMEPWRKRMPVSVWAASGALPLHRSGNVIGVLCVYSDKVAFFDEPVRGLLGQLATDISFALAGFARETLRKRAEEALRKSEEQFHTLAEAMPQIVWMSRPDGGNTFLSQKWTDYTGLTQEEGVDDGWAKPFHPDDQKPAFDAWQEARVTQSPLSIEIRLRRADGVYRWWLLQGVPHLDGAGNVLKWFGTGTDIHDLKTAEMKIRRLNRVYAVLSGINALIVRAPDRDTLFREACRIAVEEGGFRMGIICLVDQSTMTISEAASVSKDSELLALVKNILSSADDAQRTLLALSFRKKTALVATDLENDRRVSHGKECAKFGVHSMAALPVVVSDEAVGVLSLYADEPHFFDEEEMALLTELVNDIAFAISHIGKDERLKYLAYYDELTGLANRSLFLERVGQYLRGEVSARHRIAVVLLDLDRFKNINDSLGRPAGDALLRQVGEWLAENRGDANLVARLDADHFALVLPNVAPGRDLARLLDEMHSAFLSQPFALHENAVRMSATFGVALFPNDGADAETLFRNAEAALKRAKARSNRYLFYTAAMTEASPGKLSLETRLREALEKDRFVLHYQPKVSLATGQLTGAEALIRWDDPERGLTPPSQFIPSLEETGLIYEVGRWALGRALRDYSLWRAAGFSVGRIAVNVSPIQLRDPDFIVELERILGMDPLAAAGLELEITEGVMMEDVDRNIASLRAIRAMGLTVAIDDFGTGFSSLSYLAKLPADSLKIDRSFVVGMTQSPEGLALVSTIISLAHGLKMKVVAEGVEAEEQSRLLRLLGCDEMQGFLLSEPIPAEVFESKYLRRQTNAPAGSLS
jgi:diguanylate cyclase (GGDEF)-like protein/PAS domain S-box-containing protein